ncbi:hypothetical protein AN478_09450 [Thiohalorhabdus denitrificans]|uniref:Uncharacterized protein n=1 Tax=Thiohalorhabdus denitrificans TaxID=381306 RepID=A0A0P9EDB3_9GAMM|nr:hypothetical protein [Thiohalorhabdus denitrificans]KPV40306.1 hypothetical protein AN478_09450 [Thiohalorhabdus denitrificans]SCX80509.1 hypothetical protein SAMN05661077_0514 [Thiohalorhabdus denitrificans]
MQERLETIIREGRLLAQETGTRVASMARSAYQDVMYRLGWTPSEDREEEPLGLEEKSTETGPTSPEGYAAGQLWRPKDPSKKSRKILEITKEGGDYYVIWQNPEGGPRNRIKESSFTRWVRRESSYVR